jgi:hypothetical protein
MKGRTPGATTFKKYKWEITMFDVTKNQMITGRYITREHANRELGLNLSLQTFWRLRHYKPDETHRLKDNSFLKKFGHIKVREIDEPVENPRRVEYPQAK